ncbi:MAG TPA: N-acetylmuramoyl-L-alanine amidase [Opitutaceae bacterium]|nr:N-acetylmuramoyl-L-alanine amidase [Opitutaceae bacterium]
MPPAASRLAAVAAFALLGTDCLFAAEPAGSGRATPTRPAQIKPAASLAITRIDGADYFELEAAMARLGLKARARDGRRFVFGDQNSRLVIDEGREVFVDGSRIFLGNPVVLRRGDLFISRIDFERCLTPLLAPQLVGSPPRAPKVIVLDPGHGGTDDGMSNPRLQMKEKIYTLDVALRLKKLLETKGCKVVLTRKDDRELDKDKITDLRKRSEIANRAAADLFVSIHFNALDRDTKTGGSEVYTFTRQFQRSDESAGIGRRDDTEKEPAPVNRFDAWNTLLGHSIKRELLTGLKTMDRGQKTMHSAVLRGLNCPGVLVESVFLSNDTEAKLVATPAYRQQIAEAIAEGIRSYSQTLESVRPKPAAATASPAASSSPP